MRQKIEAYLNEQKENIINDLQKLVEIPSVVSDPIEGKPYGEDSAAALDKTMELCKDAGLKVLNCDYHLIHADLGENPKLGILAHADVVRPGEGWSYPPFTCTIVGDRIYGRGTTDDKGPLIGALYAMKCIQDLNIQLKSGVRLLVGGAEETGKRIDLTYYHDRHEFPPNIVALDGEFPVVNAEKGIVRVAYGKDEMVGADESRAILSIHGSDTYNAIPGTASAVVCGVSKEDLEAAASKLSLDVSFSFEEEEDGKILIKGTGVRCHSSNPGNGINALTGLLTLLNKMQFTGQLANVIGKICTYFPHGDFNGKAAGIYFSREPMGDLTLTFSVMEYEGKDLSLITEIRYPNGATKEEILEKIKGIIKELGLEYKQTISASDPHYVEPSTPFVKTLLDVYHEYTGLPATCTSAGGSTYVHGYPGVVFGPYYPGKDYCIHKKDEFLDLPEFITNTAMLVEVILRICG